MTDTGPTRPAGALGAALGVVVVLTLVLALVPGVDYAYRAPGLQIALNTADAVIALVVAYLVYGRYRQSSRTRDLLLVLSLVVLAVANLPLAAIPQSVGSSAHLAEWASLLVRTLGGLLFAAAALVGPRHRIDVGAAKRAVVVGFGVLAWLGAVGLIAAGDLPAPVPPLAGIDPGRPWVDGHPLVLALQALGVLLYASAAFAFSRAAGRERDEFLGWLAAAAVLSAGARLNYLAFPSLYSEHLYTGDLLRLGFYLLLLLGAMREIRSYWSARVLAAVARGRLEGAREVADALLPSLRAAAEQPPGGPAADPRLHELLAAGEAALAGVRADVADVLADEPLESALRATLMPLEARTGTSFDVRADRTLPSPERDVLLSLCVDAAAVAAAAGAARVRLTVTAAPRRLVVQAEGGQAAAPLELRSDLLQRLRERAGAAGGDVSSVALDDDGTTVTVDLP